jgi:hypothetical protein
MYDDYFYFLEQSVRRGHALTEKERRDWDLLGIARANAEILKKKMEIQDLEAMLASKKLGV